jgi:hypothetical protein
MKQQLTLKNAEYCFPAVAYWKNFLKTQLIKPIAPLLLPKEEVCCNAATD